MHIWSAVALPLHLHLHHSLFPLAFEQPGTATEGQADAKGEGGEELTGTLGGAGHWGLLGSTQAAHLRKGIQAACTPACTLRDRMSVMQLSQAHLHTSALHTPNGGTKLNYGGRKIVQAHSATFLPRNGLRNRLSQCPGGYKYHPITL